MKLIPDWRAAWRFWSVQLGLIGTALAGIFIAFPDAALYAWALLPQDLKSFVPARFMPLIGVAVFVTSLIARIVKQKNLPNGKAE